MPTRIVVWLTPKSEVEEEFNRWYEQEYIPAFVKDVSGIESVSRWKVPGARTYLTVYELSDEVTADEVAAAIADPNRRRSRDEWHSWEVDGLEVVQDGIFEQTFAYDENTSSAH